MDDRVQIRELAAILERRSFTATAAVKDQKDRLRLEYEPPRRLTLRGLKPEFPPHLVLTPEKIFGSRDGREWKEVPLASGLHLFYLLDPRMLLADDSVPSVKISRSFGRTDIIVRTDVRALAKLHGLAISPQLLEHLEDSGGTLRESRLAGGVSLAPSDEVPIHWMQVRDLPADSNPIELWFSG